MSIKYLGPRELFNLLAGHEAEARNSETEDEAQNFFCGRGHNVCEAEARHVREQLSVHEHED